MYWMEHYSFWIKYTSPEQMKLLYRPTTMKKYEGENTDVEETQIVFILL